MDAENLISVLNLDEDQLYALRKDIIDMSRYVSKTGALRGAQKEYLKTREFRTLTQVKALETEVDDRYAAVVKSTSKISSILNFIIDYGLKHQTNQYNPQGPADSERNDQNPVCSGVCEGADLFSK